MKTNKEFRFAVVTTTEKAKTKKYLSWTWGDTKIKNNAMVITDKSHAQEIATALKGRLEEVETTNQEVFDQWLEA